MPARVVHVITAVLIAAQVLFGIAPAGMICIPSGPCDEHAVHSDSCFGEESCSAECGGLFPPSCEDHMHGMIDLFLHGHDDCACHTHIPIPGERPAPANVRVEIAAVHAPALSAEVLDCVLDWEWRLARATPDRDRPPDFSASDQVRGLKSVRLLV